MSNANTPETLAQSMAESLLRENKALRAEVASLKEEAQEDAIVRDALILAKDVINILWVSHHANRADAAIAAIDAAMSVKSEDAMDAARYRWLRADIDGRVEIAADLIRFNADVFLDAEIDKAMSA